MEVLLVLLIIAAVVAVARNSDKAAGAAAERAAVATAGMVLVRTETVTVDDPAKLGAAINSARDYWSGGGWFRPRYVVGAPAITPDGRTAHLPLFAPAN